MKRAVGKLHEQGVMKGSYKEERLDKWYHHFDNLLSRAPVVEDEYTGDDDLTTIYYSFSFVFKIIGNICIGWGIFSMIKNPLAYFPLGQIGNLFHLLCWTTVGLK